MPNACKHATPKRVSLTKSTCFPALVMVRGMRRWMAGSKVLARMGALVFKRQIGKPRLCRRRERHKSVIKYAFDLPKQTDVQHEFCL